MNAKTTRLLKEARPLFWPWCAVAVAGVLPLVNVPQSVDLLVAALLLGFALLGALPFGNEFQHRTLALLLAQPVDRIEIWSEKLSVMAVATISAALVLILGWRISALQVDPYDAAFFASWIIATTASGTYWTLLARSTLGGLALNISVNAMVVEMPWLVLYHERALTIPLSPSTMTVSTVTFILFCYTGVMLWLGAQKLVRFQAIGGMAGDDLLMAGPSVMPQAFARWFRCRPTGAFLNLIRKELRLLRPVWLITLMSFLGWTCIAVLRLVPEHGFGRPIVSRPGSPTFLIFLAVGMVAALSIAIAILAGSLSLGEERTSGTHAWHMTLPVSARRQWLIKLVMAILTGFVCAALLPVLVLIARGYLFGSPLMFVDPGWAMLWLVALPLLTFASFWCACAFNGTVRASLWVFPVLGALVVSGQSGAWIAPKLIDLILSKFDFFTAFRFTNSLSNFLFFDLDEKPLLVAALFLAPILTVAVIQSYRLFRAQAQDGISYMVRNLPPLAAMAFLFIFSFVGSVKFVEQARQQMWILFSETHDAIEKCESGAANLDAAHPLELTVEDLAKAFPLSERTRRWLRNSRIRVAPEKPDPGRCCHPGIAWGIVFAPNKSYLGYSAAIHMASGPDCALSFHAGSGAGIVRGVCQ